MSILWNDLAKYLAERFDLPEQELRAAINQFSSRYAVDVWSVQDVYTAAGGHPMSNTAAEEILSRMEDKVDNETGMNWDVLATTIEIWWNDTDPVAQADQLRGNFVVNEDDKVLWASKRNVPLQTAIEAAKGFVGGEDAEEFTVRILGFDDGSFNGEDSTIEAGDELLIVSATFDDESEEEAEIMKA